MGCYCSKRPTNATSGSAAVSAAGSYIRFMPELSSYLNACRSDPDVLSFDAFLHQRTHLAMSNLAANAHLRSLSLHTLKEVTASLVEINQEVSRIILECRKEIWRHPDLSDLVQDYFDKGLHTLQLCSALRNCLNNFQNSQLILRLALQRFDVAEADPSLKYHKTIDELRSFKESGDPFTEEFFRVFQLICQQQLSMLEKLRLKRKKLDKKLSSVGPAWMKLSCIIFASGFAVLLICSVVADIVTGPPVAASVSAACAASAGSIGKWFDSMWSDYWDEINGEDMMVGAAKAATFAAINDMDEILVMVNMLEDQISSLVENSDQFSSFRDEAAVRFGIVEIGKKMGLFMKSIEDLTVQADQCRGDLGRARIAVLQRIIEHPP